jgi:hypothetical protein
MRFPLHHEGASIKVDNELRAIRLSSATGNGETIAPVNGEADWQSNYAMSTGKPSRTLLLESKKGFIC